MKRRKVKPEGEGDAVAELESTVTERYEQGEELAARHAQERLELDVKHRDRLLKLASAHATELTQLEARQLEELAALWKRQGRPIGPWAAGGHFRGEEPIKNGRGHHGSQR